MAKYLDAAAVVLVAGGGAVLSVVLAEGTRALLIRRGDRGGRSVGGCPAGGWPSSRRGLGLIR